MAELLLEIRSGEIPAPMQKQALKDMKRLLELFIQDLGLSYDRVESFIGPRRMTAVINGLSLMQPARQEEKRGPRVDAPEKAIQGFLGTYGQSHQDVEIRETPKGKFYFLTENFPGQETKNLIPGLVKRLIQEFPWPKAMLWQTTCLSWIRPILGGCVLFDGQSLNFDINLSDANEMQPTIIHFNATTLGHRHLSSGPLVVKDFKDYKTKLHDAYVIVDPLERQSMIQKQIQALCLSKNLVVHEDQNLLDEVTGLVEWPHCLLGSIPAQFMTLPPEVLQTSMRVHQRYFSTHHPDGGFAPYFIIVANQKPHDDGAEIIIGNERVLKARLSDAEFFYHKDRNMPLLEHAKRLNHVVFHADLGTLAQKQSRLKNLIMVLGADTPEAMNDAAQAASIAKADLVTEMVAEFPELQGIIGSYYAKDDGFNADVAMAIYNQYTPKGPHDPIPTHLPSQLLGLADRVDTLVGFFAVGLKPTGSKDPYALRRAALGVIRYLENRYSINLMTLCSQAFDGYKDILGQSGKTAAKEDVLKSLEEFFIERLKVYWRDQGIRYDYINAIMVAGLNEPLVTLKARLDALTVFMSSHQENAEKLLAGYRRATNILRKEISASSRPFQPVDPKKFETPQEKTLFAALRQSEQQIVQDLAQENYMAVMKTLACLKDPIDQFFDHVTVNDTRPEIRSNRLQLLQYIQHILEKGADFSCIQGLES